MLNRAIVQKNLWIKKSAWDIFAFTNPIFFMLSSCIIPNQGDDVLYCDTGVAATT